MRYSIDLFRLIKKEQIVNTINNGDTLVELEFQIGTKNFKVIRGIKLNIFEIYSDGVLQSKMLSSVDYQKILEDQILRLNYRAFKQIDRFRFIILSIIYDK